MDASILTTLFCFVLLILVILALNELMILKRKVNAHLDRTDLHSSKLATILSVLQQIEAKQDLIFNNAPPAPGETVEVEDDIGEDLKWVDTFPIREVGPESDVKAIDLPDGTVYFIENRGETFRQAAARALEEHKAKLSTTVPTEKKTSVVKAAQKARGDFEARLPYHTSKIDNGVIPLDAPKKRGRPRKTPLA